MWHKALRLGELRTIMCQKPVNYDPDVITRGRQRLMRWQALHVLDSPDILIQRLAADTMTEDEFLCLLGMSTADLVEQAPPTWYRRLSALYTSAFLQF